MKRLFPLIILSLLNSCGGANEQEEPDIEFVGAAVYCFKGELDSKYEVFMQLSIPVEETGPVYGEYFYSSQKKLIELKGEKEGSSIVLDEIVDGEVTGHFRGEFDHPDDFFYIGTWTSADETKSFAFELSGESEEDYDLALNSEIKPLSPSDFTDFTELFEQTELPIELNEPLDDIDDHQMLDTNTVKQYLLLPDENYNEWGYNAHYALYKFENNNYIALITQHYYSPGVGGVNDNYFELHTFNKQGEKIDYTILGCASCGDSDYDGYWMTTSEIRIDTDGLITCKETQEHVCLIEDSEDPEYFEDEIKQSSYESMLLRSGEITGDGE